MKSLERDVHLQACEFWLCGHCFQKMPATDQCTHRKVCRYWRCRYCTRKLLRAEALSHKQSCDFIICPKCGIHIQDRELLLHICIRRSCGRCCKSIPLDDYDHHQATCSYVQCRKCYARMPLAALADHRSTCAGPKYLSTAKYEPDSYATALRAILHPKRPFPLTTSVLRVMKAWTKNPYTAIIVDFEFDTYLLNTLKHEAVFQIAVANALGEWIVPPTSIIMACQPSNSSRNLNQTAYSVEGATIRTVGRYGKDNLLCTMALLTTCLLEAYPGVKLAT